MTLKNNPKRRDPAFIREVLANLDQSMELHRKMIDTQRQMKKSMALMLVDPDVWEGGKIRTTVRRLVPSTLYGDVPDKDTTFVIIKEHGEDVEVPFKDLPIELWPEDLLQRVMKRTGLRDLLVRRGFKQIDAFVKGVHKADGVTQDVSHGTGAPASGV